MRKVKDTLVNLPRGSMVYHRTYDNIMGRINNQSANRRDLALEVLSWITQCKRPIRLAELQHALSVTDDSCGLDEENIPSSRLIVMVCVGLVTIDEARDTVQLVHYTTAEYFQKRWMSWLPNANAYIATVCINYLDFDRFSTPDSGNWEGYNTDLQTNCLYKYAALYWGDHAREAYSQVKHLVAKLLRSGPRLLNSVRVLDASPLPFRFLRRTDGVTGLHVAAYFGIVDQIGELIKEGVDSKAVDNNGRTALHWAARNGQRQAVELLASQGLNVNALDAQKEDALHYSARQNNRALVELLIYLGSLVEARNSASETALLVAARSVDIEALQALLASGADPNATDQMDRNALHLAITAFKSNSAMAVKLLLLYDVSFCLCDGDNMTPLHYAVAEGNNEIIDLLLEAGANINLGVQRNKCSNFMESMGSKESVPAATTQHIRDGIGLTSLHFAACSGHSRMARYLLEKGADPNARCCYGETPLHIAIRGGLFTGRGKGTSVPYPLLSDDPWTDRTWHVDGVYDTVDDHGSEEADKINTDIEEERLAVVNALLENPEIDVNIQNIHLDCPLHRLKYDRRTSAATFAKLLDRGANILSVDDKGRTALHYACERRALPIVKVLLARGCCVDTPDHDGLSALHLAVSAGQRQTVQAIFRMDEKLARSYCARVDAQGRNLLHHLMQDEFSSTEITELLLEYGCNLCCTDNDWQSPLSTYLGTLKIGNRTAMCQFLLQHGSDPYWTSPTGLTLGHLAARHYICETWVLEALSDYGLDLSLRDSSKKGILHHGAIGGSLSLDVLNFLHGRKLLDPHDRDVDGKTPLDYASEKAQKERHPDSFCESRWEESLKALQDFIEMKCL